MLFVKIIMGCWLAASVISDQQTNVKNVHDASSSVNSGISTDSDSGREKPSGGTVSVTKALAPFTALAIDGAFDVEVQRCADCRITVSAGRSAIEDVTINASNGKLCVGLKKDYTPDGKIKLIIELPLLARLDFSGAGNIVINDVAGERLEIFAENAAGDLVISGNVKDFRLKINGAVSVDAGKLMAQNADVDAKGASTATVNVQGSLNAKAAGAATVRYCGTPKSLKEQTSGAGSLENIK
ncbi:MAG: DUF2807 domain-containing protein [Victivallaceae bacterium]|jgi:hypothetical protein